MSNSNLLFGIFTAIFTTVVLFGYLDCFIDSFETRKSDKCLYWPECRVDSELKGDSIVVLEEFNHCIKYRPDGLLVFYVQVGALHSLILTCDRHTERFSIENTPDKMYWKKLPTDYHWDCFVSRPLGHLKERDAIQFSVVLLVKSCYHPIGNMFPRAPILSYPILIIIVLICFYLIFQKIRVIMTSSNLYY